MVEEVRVLAIAGHEIQLLTVAALLPHEDDLHAAGLALGSLSYHCAHEWATSQMKGVRTWCLPNILCQPVGYREMFYKKGMSVAGGIWTQKEISLDISTVIDMFSY